MNNKGQTNKLIIIIPVHNRKGFTEKCLHLLEQQHYCNFKVVVVDDGSTDSTAEMIHGNYPNVTLLSGDGTLWWAGATNMGCRYALSHGAELILTLNDDVHFSPDYIENLLEAHLAYPTSLIGSINLTQEKTPRLLYAGIESVNFWTAKYVKRGKPMQEYKGEFSGLLPTHSLPGRGVLIPRKVFETIGLFDEKHFRHYAADQDFSLRAKSAGFGLMVNADNPVYSPDEADRTGGDEQSISSFLRSFFTMRSCNYLPVLIRYNYRHHPYKIYFPIFLMLDLGRRIVSFTRIKMRSR